MNALLGVITDITDIPTDPVITANIYIPGTVYNVNFEVAYSELTAPQKQVVDDYRALLISLAPEQ